MDPDSFWHSPRRLSFVLTNAFSVSSLCGHITHRFPPFAYREEGAQAAPSDRGATARRSTTNRRYRLVNWQQDGARSELEPFVTFATTNAFYTRRPLKLHWKDTVLRIPTGDTDDGTSAMTLCGLGSVLN